MLPDPSLLTLSAAMARHAGHVHAVTARNIALADAGGATAQRPMAFAAALSDEDTSAPMKAQQTEDRITLDDEMIRMAQNAGRHDAAVTIWSRTLDMIRLAAASPR